MSRNSEVQVSGAFLTLAIVVGEYTIATFLARSAFGPYIAYLGTTKVQLTGAH